MITVGIDPGKSGGIVAVHNGKVIGKDTMPINEDGTIDNKTLSSIIRSYTAYDDEVRFGLEKVHAIYGMSAKSCFQFGMNFQACISALDITGAKWEFIQPKTWQKEVFEGMNEIKNTKGKRDTKKMALMACNRMYPDTDLTATERSKKPHDGIVDALCIAEYLQRRK